MRGEGARTTSEMTTSEITPGCMLWCARWFTPKPYISFGCVLMRVPGCYRAPLAVRLDPGARKSDRGSWRCSVKREESLQG